MLTDEQIERYARQLVIPGWGEEIQERLSESAVLIIGAGGLGAAVIPALAAAGVGTIGIMDGDKVELTNLNRQAIHTTDRIGMAKTGSAAAFISALNPDVSVAEYAQPFTADTPYQLLADYDVVIDCSDNPATRYALNLACLRAGTALIFGGAVRMDGQVTTILPNSENSPCLRCVFPQAETDYDQAPSCAQSGIISPITSVIGALQAQEALKILTGIGEPLSASLVIFDGMNSSFMTISTERNPDCSDCHKAGR